MFSFYIRKSLLIIAMFAMSSLFASNYIIVDGSTFTLNLYDSENQLIQFYYIGIGKNGMGKKREGDNKTPIGEYEILWKASRFANKDGGYPIIEGHAFCTSDNMFTDDPEIGDPDESLWTDSFGGDEAVVLGLNYPNESDRARGYTGYAIEIHATKLGGIGECSSAGCIRMHPEDARQLYNLVDVGTKVIIFE